MISVNRENGFYSSFCPLSCISWMINNINDSFFLVLGTTSCAYFVQTPRPLRLLNNSHCGSIVFDEGEVGFGINEENLISLVSQVVNKYSPKIIFLMGSCFTEIQKIDLQYIAFYLQKYFKINFVPVRISGFDYAYTYGEDALLSNLVELCPKPETHKKEVVIVGSLSKSAMDMFLREFKELDIPLAGFLPSTDITNLPLITSETLIVPLHPCLNLTLQKIQRTRGSKILLSLFPFGPDGSRDFFEKICIYFNKPVKKIREKEVQTWVAINKEVEIIKNKKIFFIGDNVFELPLARFLLSCGARIVEVGTPYVNFVYHKEELNLLSKYDVCLVESPNNIEQLKRIKKLQPDLIVTPLSLSYPLEKMGFKTLWSVKLFQTETCNYGFENSQLLLRMFVNSLG